MAEKEKFIQKLKAKKEYLYKVKNANLDMALTVKAWEACVRRMDNAIKYIVELKEIEEIMYSDADFQVVTLKKFESILENADIVRERYDGDFCKFVAVQNFAQKLLWVVWFAPNKVL